MEGNAGAPWHVLKLFLTWLTLYFAHETEKTARQKTKIWHPHVHRQSQQVYCERTRILIFWFCFSVGYLSVYNIITIIWLKINRAKSLSLPKINPWSRFENHEIDQKKKKKDVECDWFLPLGFPLLACMRYCRAVWASPSSNEATPALYRALMSPALHWSTFRLYSCTRV